MPRRPALHRLLIAVTISAGGTAQDAKPKKPIDIRDYVAAEPTPGKVTRRVAIADTNYSYACYVPEKYDPERRWPALYLFSPVSDGLGAISIFYQAAKDLGLVCIASNDTKNGPLMTQAIEAALTDSRRRFKLDPSRFYVTGFSGGSRVATWFGEKHKAVAHLAMGGVYMPGRPRLPDGMVYFLSCGKSDFNHPETLRAIRQLEQRKIVHRAEFFVGGHTVPPPEIMRRALEWFEVRWRKGDAAKKDLEAELDALGKLHEKGLSAKAYWRAAETLEWFAGVNGVERTSAFMKVLAKTTAVRRELRALKRFEKYRVEEAKLEKRAIQRRYRSLMQTFRGTRAAELARARLEEIQGR